VRFAVAISMSLILFGCSGDNTPLTAPGSPVTTVPVPPAPTAGSATLWVIVVQENGICILGAKVDVIVKDTVVQSATITEPCDAWWVDGLFFKDLTPGVEVTLRASAAGYVSQEKTAMPWPMPGSMWATIIELPKVQAR
jgi:hypothetical protein